MQEVSASVLRRIRDSLSSCHLVVPHALAELRRRLQEEKAIFIIFPERGRRRTGSTMLSSTDLEC